MKILRVLLAASLAAAGALHADELVTDRLQAEIDRISAAGGGKVTVPAGTHTVANLKLKNGVELHIPEGCVLQGSTNRLDYGYPDQVRGLPLRKPTGVVLALGVTNAAITGSGTIDGRGGFYDRVLERGKGRYPRKMRGGWGCVRAFDCKGLRIEGVRMVNPVTWTCFLRQCEDVVIRKVTIRAHCNWNNDGLDLEVRRALIEDCDIDSEDDALVFKTMDAGWESGDVKVRNCILSSSASCLKFGTETKGAFRRYDIRDCKILARTPPGIAYGPRSDKVDYGRTTTPEGAAASGGIVVAMVDGGQLEDVRISDIEFGAGVQVPIFVRLGRRREPSFFSETYHRNVTIENVRMTAPAASRIANSITGVPGLEVDGVTLRNVHLICPGGGTVADTKIPVREAERLYPSAVATFKGVLPAYGFFVRHARNVKFENVAYRLMSPDGRPAEVRLDNLRPAADKAAH